MTTLLTTALFHESGEPLPVEPTMLAKGGEGAIYRIRHSDGLLAKIYTSPPDENRVAKLRAMIASHTPALVQSAAWPVGLICDQVGSAQRVVGFVMPEVTEHRELHQLFSPAERKRYFPNSNWKMLALAGSNLARVVASIHQSGGVIGDLNQNNVLVSQKATVQLIDCDSFQFRRSNGEYWTSDVGKEEYLPPELQSANLRGLVRLPDHDNFALAVLIFQLLFMGRHPFTGRHQRPDDFPIGEAIVQNAYFYGRDAASKKLLPPPGVITPAALLPETAEFFERAFTTRNRPCAIDWSDHLLQIANQMKVCSESTRHLIFESRGACSWCHLKKTLRIDYFPEVSNETIAVGKENQQVTITVNLELLKQTIEAIPIFKFKYNRPTFPKSKLRKALPLPEHLKRPEPLEYLDEPAEPPESDHAVSVILRSMILPVLVLGLIAGATINANYGFMSFIICLACFIAARAISVVKNARNFHQWQNEFEHIRILNERIKLKWNDDNAEWLDELSKRQKQRDELLSRLVDREQQWTSWLDQIAESDQQLRQESKQLLQKIGESLEKFQNEIDQQTRACQVYAVEAWLESHLIRDANIPQIGRTRVATLASFGIETAADVVRLVQNQSYSIPGFGQRLLNNLWYWAADVQSKFKPDSASALPLETSLKIKGKYENEIQAMVQRIYLIIEDLKGFMPLVKSKEPRVETFFRVTAKEYLEANLDVKLMETPD